jgi:hypothetical protein
MRRFTGECTNKPIAITAAVVVAAGGLALPSFFKRHPDNAVKPAPRTEQLPPRPEINSLQETAERIGKLTVDDFYKDKHHPEVLAHIGDKYILSAVSISPDHPEGTVRNPVVAVNATMQKNEGQLYDPSTTSNVVVVAREVAGKPKTTVGTSIKLYKNNDGTWGADYETKRGKTKEAPVSVVLGQEIPSPVDAVKAKDIENTALEIAMQSIG